MRFTTLSHCKKKKEEHDSEGECVHTFVSVRVDEMQCCD